MNSGSVSKAANGQYDLVVVGGGGGGLSAAVAAAEKGVKKIVVLEARRRAGGNALAPTGIFGIENYGAYAIDIIFYLVKIFLVILFSVTLIRIAIARLKIDQIVYTYWIPLTLIGLLGLICVMWDPWTLQEQTIYLFGNEINWNAWPTIVQLLGL